MLKSPPALASGDVVDRCVGLDELWRTDGPDASCLPADPVVGFAVEPPLGLVAVGFVVPAGRVAPEPVPPTANTVPAGPIAKAKVRSSPTIVTNTLRRRASVERVVVLP